MATQSAPPPNPPDQNPVSEVAKPVSEVQQDAKDISPPSVFVNSEPIREDQVQNAVKFLSHPKVKGSPVMYRRSFLERKGLTKEEIDEAFRRVPDPTPTVSTGQPTEGGHLNSSNMQQQTPSQALQPASNTPVGTISKGGTSALYRLGWQQALLAVGLLAISGAGTALVFKKAIVPRLKSWIRKVVSEEDEENKSISKPSLAEEAATAAKSAAAAAADVARASQEMVILKNGEKKYNEELMSLLGMQVQEMKLMSNAIRNLEGKTSISGQEDHGFSLNSSKPPYSNGKSDFSLSSARPLSPPASVEPSVAPPHPKSYMEIMDMVQRGEKPSNIREINDLPPNPNQPVPNPSLAPRPKPWEAGQMQSGSNQARQSQDNGLLNNQMNGNNSVPWWQQKQSNNVRINEIESRDENGAGSSGAQTIDRPPIQRSWVPPQPPPVAMAEAAAAIRQPKKSTYQSEPLTDDQFLARSSEVTNELQRVTKISESGGVTEANGGSPVLNTEIQTEESNSYVEA
ncbi:Peroxisomal membrane protein PEX14 [Heracleum sosnowskyi]|uniref:Peroxisomal membrane protein PEX14 n=1 Tax=Heracleum sosnowskyi TaxID=360622 RepID=A0AAD8M896_9APIA|nr:Peroxisomal membrane protein PEX14 [Heracleum sosnowskyi]